MRLCVCAVLLALVSFASTAHQIALAEVEPSIDKPSSGSVIRLDEDAISPELGGTLRAGLSLAIKPSTLNPLIDWYVAALGSSSVYRQVFSSLVRWNETGCAVPDLAADWAVSDGGLQWTFYLFQNVTWHDGVEFNASDVEFTYNLVRDNPDVVDYWRSVGMFMDVPSAQMLNASAVVFQLENLSLPFLDLLWMIPIIPKHLYEGVDLLTNPYNETPVGTGPFKFVNWTEDVGIWLEANAEFFRGRPYLDNLLMRWDIPSEDLPSFLRNNTIDLIPNVADPSRILELDQTRGIAVKSQILPAFWTMGVNLSHSILRDLKVRQALAHAMNLSRICEVSHLGCATPAVGPVPPSMAPWHNPYVTRYEHNLSRAEELLDQAGYPKDAETGVRFEIGLEVGDWDPFRINASRMIKDYLESVGVATTLSIEPHEGFAIDYDLLVIGFRYHGTDPDLHSLWHTNGIENYWNYSSTQVDSLTEQGLTALNRTERRQIYHEVQEILATDLPSICLYHRISLTAHNHDFHGFPENSCIGWLDPIILERVHYTPTLSCQCESPVRICLTDAFGNKTGYWNGSILAEIPGSEYIGDQELVKVSSPYGNYTIEIWGHVNGTYVLEVVDTAFDYKHLYLPTGTIRESQVRRFSIEVHSDGTISIVDHAVDLDGDSDCDIYDVVLIAGAYGTQPGDPEWNMLADIAAPIDKVDIFDVVALVGSYGQSW